MTDHEPVIAILRADTTASGAPALTIRGIHLEDWERLIKVAQWVSRGRSFAFTSDPCLAMQTYPDAMARRALGALHDAGLLPMAQPLDEDDVPAPCKNCGQPWDKRHTCEQRRTATEATLTRYEAEEFFEEDEDPSPLLAFVKAACTADGQHLYLSTGCLHDDHDYCKSMTGLQGAKRPGECKHCQARCICRCHDKEDT